MNNKFVKLLVCLMATVALAGCAKNGATAGKKVTFTLSTPDPDGSSITEAAREFARQIEQKSGGEIEVKVYPNGSLYGGDPAAAVKQLSSGGLDMLTLTASLYANFVPEFTMLSIPYLFKDTETYVKYINSPFGDELLGKLDGLEITGLSFWTRSFRKITTSLRPINVPEDLKGIKLRVLNNPLWVEYFQAAGAITTPMAFGEVYNALQLKTVDGQENPIDIPLSSKFFEVQKYLSETDHITDAWIFAISKKKFNELSEKQKNILVATVRDIQTWKLDFDAKFDKEAAAKLTEAGMVINEVSPQNKEKFAAISKKLFPTFKQIVKNDKLFSESLEYLNVKE